MQAVKVNFEAFLSQSLVCSWRRRRAQCWGSPLRCTSALPKSNFFFFSFSSSPSSPPVYLARCEDCPDRMKGWVCQSWTASGRCGHGIPFGSRLALTLRVTRLFSLFFSGSPWPLTFFFFTFIEACPCVSFYHGLDHWYKYSLLNVYWPLNPELPTQVITNFQNVPLPLPTFSTLLLQFSSLSTLSPILLPFTVIAFLSILVQLLGMDSLWFRLQPPYFSNTFPSNCYREHDTPTINSSYKLAENGHYELWLCLCCGLPSETGAHSKGSSLPFDSTNFARFISLLDSQLII